MSRGPCFSAVHCTALSYVVLVRLTVSSASASSLRHVRNSNVLRGRALAEDFGAQQSVVGQSCEHPPCPCLVTPAPIVTAEDLQATQMLLAADTAMAQGITAIGQAADQAGSASLQAIQDISTNGTQREAKATLALAETNSTVQLDAMLASEMQRQANLETQMEADAKNAASISAAHLKVTSEEWAKNQALHYISDAADRTMKDALTASASIPQIRQHATEQAKGAIDASAEALAVAQKAQAMAQIAPKELIIEAATLSDKLKSEQEELTTEIERVTKRSEDVAEVAHRGHDLAMVVLKQAIRDATEAKQALKSATDNAAKIETLKENTQAVYNEAAKLNSE